MVKILIETGPGGTYKEPQQNLLGGRQTRFDCLEFHALPPLDMVGRKSLSGKALPLQTRKNSRSVHWFKRALASA
jgi:hypothetical protein